MIEELVAAAEPGLVGTQSPRYFGFVIGGALDAAIAADWLTSAWDQNGAAYPGGPAAAVAEEVACEWLLDILGLPDDAGVGLTTGCIAIVRDRTAHGGGRQRGAGLRLGFARTARHADGPGSTSCAATPSLHASLKPGVRS